MIETMGVWIKSIQSEGDGVSHKSRTVVTHQTRLVQ